MSANPKFGVGAPVRRKEDDALLRGAGHYVADYAPAGSLHAVMVRSPHAHARFSFGDLARIRSMPGVRTVLTAADVSDLGPLPTPGVISPDIVVPPYKILEGEVVRYVGDAVAFVVADTLAQARDAAEAMPIDWDPLPHVVGAETALNGCPELRRRVVVVRHLPSILGSLYTALSTWRSTRRAYIRLAFRRAAG